MLDAALANLLSPAILFFVLGMGAAALRSDLALPEGLGKGLSIFLLIAIGFKGGAGLAGHGIDAEVMAGLGAAIALSFTIPFLAFALLRLGTGLVRVDAAAVAAHFGSISVVTFMTAIAFLDDRAVAYQGYLVAMMALMETPAILSGLLLAGAAGRLASADPQATTRPASVLLNGSVVLLLGSLVIGYVSGPDGLAQVKPLLVDPFYGVLCLFLLDMGLLAGRRLADFRAVGLGLFAFGLYMPLIGAAIGLATASLLAMAPGDATLLAVLTASASYIVVPAAMRLALPAAKPSLYVTLSLGITFPFNVTLGIPLYFQAAQWLG